MGFGMMDAGYVVAVVSEVMGKGVWLLIVRKIMENASVVGDRKCVQEREMVVVPSFF